MIPYSKITFDYLETIDFKTVSKRSKSGDNIEYYNIECALDIETTSTLYKGEKTSFMYIWMLGIGYENKVIYGRTWEQLKGTLEVIESFLGLSYEVRLPIYIHNLGYEFQFMRKNFDWLEVFSISERKPITATTSGGIEFRDSYILSGYSLENTAKNLPKKYSIKKMVGDLDYSLVRTSNTPLTKEELKYCENDILIILAYIKNEILENGGVHKIPLTNTSRVRNYVRSNCLYPKNSNGSNCAGKAKRFRSAMKELKLSDDNYIQLKRCFMGGFTHSNPTLTNEVLENVTSYDLTSSYPTVMLAEKFPMGSPVDVNINTMREYEELCLTNCVMMDVYIEGLENKLGYESYLSEHKCYNIKNPLTHNGRIWSADSLITTITEMDFNIIKHVYKWEKIAFKNVKAFKKGYLPKPIIESILNLYQKKTELKDVEGSEVEYLLSKGMLNSIYGMCVTDFVKDNHIYDDEGWGLEKIDTSSAIEEYNNDKNRFLYYPWGVWVTAYARTNLWFLILNIGDDYIYSDTDSVKFRNPEKHIKKVEAYNNRIGEKLLAMTDHYNLDPSLLSPCTIKGVKKPLGIWELEGNYNRFKTLGSKRYLFQKGDYLELTLAGLPKKKGLEYLKKHSKEKGVDIFDVFNDNLYVPPNHSGKMTHTYIDDCQEFEIVDYLGKSSLIKSLSGIHLEDCDFTLSMGLKFLNFIEKISKGEIYKGEEYT